MLRSLACISLVCAALAGTASASPDARSAGTFASQANAACAAYFRKLQALPRPTTVPAIATFMRGAHPIAVRFVRQVGKFRPPSGQAATYRGLLADLNASNGLDAGIIAAAERGNRARVRTLFAREDALDTKINAAWAKLGARVCARGPA
jgi:hypothetical protein